jgi:hypothetical protein
MSFLRHTISKEVAVQNPDFLPVHHGHTPDQLTEVGGLFQARRSHVNPIFKDQFYVY